MGRVLYVRGFHSSFTNQDLKSIFMPFGLVKKARVTSNEQKLYGIVTYYYEKHAEIAMQTLHNQTIDKITWFVVECEKGCERNSHHMKEALRETNRQKTLYLRDFPADLTTDKLKEIFEKYGLICSVCINDKAAFVTFDNPENASKALEAEKLMKLDGKRVFVDKLKKKQNIIRVINKNKNSKINKKDGAAVQSKCEDGAAVQSKCEDDNFDDWN